MPQFQDLLHKRNKRIKEQGGITSILGPFDRLSEYYGGFTKSSITAITASSGVGKTKFVKYLTVHNVLKQTHKTNIKVKLITTIVKNFIFKNKILILTNII